MNIGQLKDYTEVLRKKASALSNTDAYKEAAKRNDEIDSELQRLHREYAQRMFPVNRIKLINDLSQERNNLQELIRYYSGSYLASERLAKCCGIVCVNGLSKIHPILQAYHLAKSMNDWNALQVVFTDTTKSRCYEEAKKIAVQGVVTHNPNSGSEVSHWTMTAEMLPDLEKAEPINPPLFK